MIALLIATLLAGDPAAGTYRTREGNARVTYGFSVFLCYHAQAQKKLKAQLAEEQEVAKTGGVVNKSEVYALSKALVRSQKAEAQVRARLKGHAPLACTTPGIPHLVECMRFSDSGWRDGTCDDEDWETFSAAFVE